MVYTNSLKLQSDVITFLRFPLAVGVIMIHTSFSDVVINGQSLAESMSLKVYDFVYEFLNTAFMQMAVPLFFFISGYLFFCKTTNFGLMEYGQKMKKRARTLLLPYVFWNLVMIAVMYFGQILFPGLLSGNNMMIADYSIKDWIMSFWDISYRTGGLHLPMNGSLWFIRDLMVVMVLSPLIWLTVKYLKYWGVMILMLAWFSGWDGPFTGLSAGAMFFFAAGAWFGINRVEFVRKIRTACILLLFGGDILATVILNVTRENAIWLEYANKMMILAGCSLMIQVSAYFIRSGLWKSNLFLAGSSFFLFAYHSPVVGFLKKSLLSLFDPDRDLTVLGIYFLCVALTVLIGLGLYWGLKTTLPKFTSLITGGR